MLVTIAIAAIIVVSILNWGNKATEVKPDESTPVTQQEQSSTVQILFPSDRYPETAKHIQDAIQSGHPNTCTIDRDGAENNRKLSLRGVETKKGYDRDEWPMAMCAEGGEGADIEYISPSDNRGAGSWVGNKLDEYPDGTVVEFIIE
ncbi:NucA/NucB deoxyribonuclease domain-containing protein [Paenibacillus polysaccharolyticus]|uniref:NucA/NucB deoxyribonuclease domain-containing protein n=1 Tax=Paenibacillus polysaccharolyticus TaxID=582692 RepID=UPI003EBC71D7